MVELTRQQRDMIATEQRPILIDPDTQTEYVLVRKDLFDRISRLLADDDYDPDEGMTHINEIMADDDAHDPLLESYQQRPTH